MERIWAPWRMEYVSAPPAAECLFCWAAETADPDVVLVAGRRAIAMLNAYPYNSGHILVAPRVHVPTIADLCPEDLCYLAEMVRVCLIAVERMMFPAGFNVGINIGKAAGAGIAQHVHVHVVPRWEGDTNFMSVVADTRVVPEALQACRARLQPVLTEVAAEYGLIDREHCPGGETR
ncbi:MAG: HIT domain-containing protein [Armatimonadetes bacterium]|nr:HIT domain-containing protein [Armatimonadota bacterium]